MSLSGVYPALPTPFDSKGRVDMISVARLLARAEAHGCQGVVFAGTTGEGSSLSAVEKRDLIRESISHRGPLQVILGLATNSLDEAIWLCKRAADFDCAAVLAMPPSFFRDATCEGGLAWMRALIQASPVPVLAYNFPKYMLHPFTAEALGYLGKLPMFAGCKDSSGTPENLGAFRTAVGSAPSLMTGRELLLPEAKHAGWNGTISGVASVLGNWVCEINKNDAESAAAKVDLLKPIADALRDAGMTPCLKALLHAEGVLETPDMRLPLEPCNPDAVERVKELIHARLGGS